MSVRLIVWRHGRTSWNVAHRFQGHADIALDDVGHDQADEAAAVLAAEKPHAIVSSDLRRARDTAEALARACGQEVAVDAGLREAYAADWEGLTHEQIQQRDAGLYRRWREDSGVRPGGTGETAVEVAMRMEQALHRHLLRRADGETLVLVTHGGSARALVGRLIGMPTAVWKRMSVLGNCGWAELVGDSDIGWRLHAYNRGA